MPAQPYPEPTSTGIKSWAEEDRPREKLILKGKHTLSESELIAILVRTGTKEKTAVDVAKDLMRKVNNDLDALGKLSVKDILNFGLPGIGETKAITIVAALELGRRRLTSEVKDKEKIITSRDAYDMLYPLVADKSHEEFWIVLLNRGNKVIEKILVSSGGLTGTVADVRMIFNHAIKSQATSLVLCHNHPSGNVSPSQTDIDLTKKLVKAGETLDIKVVDHLIIGENKYYSFADEGLL
ncbi:MAG TPA: DNA repair protein RadC [Chitinophagales bacterium]|nr:DNA repair protein RadC [Chitinophagales bacterium]